MCGLAVELIIVIFSVEMFVSFNCSPVVDWKVGSRLTAVVNSESQCLIPPVPGPSSSPGSVVVPVEFLHVVLVV